MSTFLQDFRYAWRQLYKNRGVSLTAILSLSLGIGATVSVFSIIYAVLMNPWPYQGADRIANVALLDKSGKEQNYGLNGPQTRDLTKAHSLEYVVAFNGWNLTVTGSDVPEDLQAMYFTGNVFQMLGVPALLGRCRVGGGASGFPDAGHRPPLKPCMQFSRTRLSRRLTLPGRNRRY